ncbi:hypothetical protein H4582DRAFT_2038608 [Lactarius indigo]|nr:hypothetical protein H4582DRAFT_2038608 [Lactarius indigo]
MLGCCFGALIASKLVDDLGSPTSLGGYVQGAELACILAILGIEKRGDSPLPLPHLLHFINFWNVVSLMSGESDLSFTAAGIPADMLDIAQDTLHILADHLSESMSVFEGLPMDQRQLPQEIYSGVVNALRSDQPNDQTMETIDQLRQILETLPSTEERIQNTSMQNLGP